MFKQCSNDPFEASLYSNTERSKQRCEHSHHVILEWNLSSNVSNSPNTRASFFYVYIMWCVCVCAHVFAVRHHESKYRPETILVLNNCTTYPS